MKKVRLTVVRGKNFRGETIVPDGREFVECEFDQETVLRFEGGPWSFDPSCRFYGGPPKFLTPKLQESLGYLQGVSALTRFIAQIQPIDPSVN